MSAHEGSGIFRFLRNCGKSDYLIIGTSWDFHDKKPKDEIKLDCIWSATGDEIESAVCNVMNIPRLPFCGIGDLVASYVGPNIIVGYTARDSKSHRKKCQVDKMTRKAQHSAQNKK